MSSDEGQRGLNKTAWESAAYVVDPYLGLARAQGAGARKAGEDPRMGSGNTEATLLPKKVRKATRPTTCQVDGCGRDLAGEKAYLQRYSVCEQHFKADLAVVHGQEVRFCQQCNKFQDLREFEGARRSCAARSKDRNLRRRLQTTLQKGNSSEELTLPSTLMNPHRQQSGSPGRSGPMDGGGGSDDSGGRAGSGDVSMGGSAAVTRRPGAGSGGSDYSLDVRGAAAMTAAMGSLRAAHAASAGVQSRQHALPPPQQPTGSGGNGGGASSGNMDVAGHQGRDNRASGGTMGGWFTVEQVAQSYEPEAGLTAGVAATLNRRVNAGAGAGGDVGSMLMDIDNFLAASSSNPYATHQSRHSQHMVGNAQTSLTLDVGGGGGPRAQELPYPRKVAPSVAGGGGGSSGAAGWGPPASLSMLEAFDSLRHPQQASQLSQHQQQQQPQLTLRPTGLQLQQNQSPLTGGWLTSVTQRQQQQSAQYSLAEGGLGGQHQQPTLGGGGGDGSAAALLEQLQGAVAGMGRGGLAAVSKDDLSLVGLMSGPRGRTSPSGSALGPGRGSGPGLHSDQLDGPRSTTNASRGLLQQHQGQSQTLPLSSLLPGPPSQHRDDLSAMIKERRAALIRQQLLQQQHRQQQQQQLPLLQQHQQLQQQDLLMQQEQLALLGAYGEGAFMGLTPTEQLQLRLLAAGASGGTGAAGLEDFFDVGAGIGANLGTDIGGNLGCGRLGGAGAATVGPGASASLAMAQALGMGRSQPSTDPNLDAIHLLEHYALAGGGGSGLAARGGGAAKCVGGGQMGFGGGVGHGTPGSGGPTNNVGGIGGSGDGMGRYNSGDDGGGAGPPSHGPGDHGSGGSGGGSSRLLSGLFPGAGGRDDALAARVCLKLFSCMPEDLPGDMLLRLRRWAVAAESDVMQIFMRPGCVHVIANVRHGGGGQAALERNVLGGGNLGLAVAALRGAFDSSGLLRGRRVVVQASEGPRGAFEYDGAAGGYARWVPEATFVRAPSVTSVLPAAVPCGMAAIAVVSGRNLLRPGTRFFARCGGRSYELKPLVPQPSPSVLAAAVAAGPAPHARQVLSVAAIATSEIGGSLSSDSSAGLASPPGADNGITSPSAVLVPKHFMPGTRLSLNGSDQCLSSWASPEPSPTPELSRTPALAAATDSRRGRGAAERSLGGGVGTESVFLHVPALPRHGLIAVEAAHSDVDVMGAWAAGVACQDSATVAELNGWLRRSADVTSGRWLLLELGVLLDYDSVLPSLLQEPLSVSTASYWAGGGSARRGDTGGLSMGQQADTGGGSVPAVSARSHQRTPQQKQQQQQQHGQQQRVVPVASNPLPCPVERDADQGSLVAAAAAACSGALSAMAYTGGEPLPQPPILSARPDGSLELRLLPSSATGSGGSEPGAVAAGLQRSDVPGPATAWGGLARRLYGEPSAGSGAELPYAVLGTSSPHHGTDSLEEHRITLSDDTKVPDAAGRPHEASFRRLLAHPLLHPGCRRAMEASGARLLAYAVASGLPLLATGLLEWLMVMEAPACGVSMATAAAIGSVDADAVTSTALAGLFARVASRAAAATARAAAATAARTAAHDDNYTGRPDVYPNAFGLSNQDDSSRDSSADSLSEGPSGNLGAGFSLLHLAVMSGRSAMVLQVLDWADTYGSSWPLDEQAGPGRVTALHLAAALRDGGDVARLLLSLSPPGQDAWLLVRDVAGRTPADIAHSAGLQHLNHFCLYGEDLAFPAPSVEGLSGRVSTHDCSSAGHGAAADAMAAPDHGAEIAGGDHQAATTHMRYHANGGWLLVISALVGMLLAAVLGALYEQQAPTGTVE